MRKIFMLLLALLFFLASFVLEGGNIAYLIAPTALFPIILCTLFTTMFTYEISDIIKTFSEAFSTKYDLSQEYNYKKYLLIIKNLQQGVLFWSISIFAVAIIIILTNLLDPKDMGRPIAISTLCILYGTGLRALVLIPMEQTINNKLLQIKSH